VRDIFGFDGFETGVGVELSMSDLDEVRRGGEPDNVKCLRQLCVLLIASDYDIKAFCDCKWVSLSVQLKYGNTWPET
jgi:hypothetical protein